MHILKSQNILIMDSYIKSVWLSFLYEFSGVAICTYRIEKHYIIKIENVILKD